MNLVDPNGQITTVLGGAIGGAIAGGIAGGISGMVSSWAVGDSWSGVINAGIVGAGIGAIAGGVTGAVLGAGIPGGLGFLTDIGWGFDLGLLTGEHAALTSKIGAIAGAITGIFTDPTPAYGNKKGGRCP